MGLNETEAKEKNIPYEVTRFDLEVLDRAIADGEAHGVVKVLAVPGKDKLLGVTIAGEQASAADGGRSCLPVLAGDYRSTEGVRVFHTARFHGVLAPNTKLRPEIIPSSGR